MKLFISYSILFLGCFSACKLGDNNTQELKNNHEMKEKGSFFIKDGDNKTHEIIKISTEEFQNYVNQKQVTFCDSLYRKYQVNAYQVFNGSVIVEESGKYALYPSLETLSLMLVGYSGP